MTRMIRLFIAFFIAGALCMVTGCSGGGSGVVFYGNTPVTIQKKNGYYTVTLDYTSTTHREMGRQYALAIKAAVPEYERIIDNLLYIQAGILSQATNGLVTFDTAVARARLLVKNLNPDYQDEIAGMQEVFNHIGGELGDGHLSQDKLLVFLLFPDVLRPSSCSASAAFGDASVTGKTILGRNLDWFSATLKSAAAVHAITTFKNGSKSICNVSVLGQLAAGSMFNAHNIFGAVLDAETGAAYPAITGDMHSYVFDLRYALENNSTLSDVANYMVRYGYTFNHLIFLADQNRAGVVENYVNLNGGTVTGRGLRVDTSALNQNLPPTQLWGITGAVATVNDFRLPNNFNGGDVPEFAYNTSRWASFLRYYGLISAKGLKFDTDLMKTVTGYPGPGFNGEMEQGAIFLSEPVLPTNKLSPSFAPQYSFGYGTLHSIVMKMDTMEMWIHFTPQADFPPLLPNYRQISNPLY